MNQLNAQDLLIKGKVRQTQTSLLVLIKRHVSAYSEAINRFTVLETIVCVWRMLRSHHRAYTHEIQTVCDYERRWTCDVVSWAGSFLLGSAVVGDGGRASDGGVQVCAPRMCGVGEPWK